ncbi:hypothetical protein [Proteiniphilum acetatigenes]|uniref:hypothetical protein n=1 Tax=Proteiniphilum acetatigenes TaxID=294710 RepID=UPI00037F3FA2|nr:hypothetical protein [Proteiniphilum acetatigenes]
MELDKYNRMTELIDNNLIDSGIYANFFGDDYLYIYNLSRIDKNQISIINAPVTSAEDNGRRNKTMIEISTEKAQIFKKENDK